VGEPYYPIPNPENQALYEKYRQLAVQEEKNHHVYFVGRLANYKYFNMDDAILNALTLFESILEQSKD
jgi:UDP-galactopyranose mutase